MRRASLVVAVVVPVLVAPATARAETVKAAEVAEVLNRPGERGTLVVRVKKGQALPVLGREGRWIHVKVGSKSGWIRRSDVDAGVPPDDPTTHRPEPEPEPESGPDPEPAGPPAAPSPPLPPRPHILRASAALGTMFISGATRTTGGVPGVPDNYDIGTSAFTIGIGGELRYPVARDYQLGAEAGYRFTIASPGIAFQDGHIGVKLHDVDLRMVGGYDLHAGVGAVLLARVGLHFDSFRIPLDNAARIPAETLLGPTVGVGVDVPLLTRSIGLQASLDSIFIGSRVQTTGLQDGSTPRTVGLWLDVQGHYRWKHALTFDVGYQLTYLHNSFGAPVASSKRDHTGTEVQRDDTHHAFTLGISRWF